MPTIKQIIVLLIIVGFIFSAFGYWVLPKIINRTAVSNGQNNTFVAGLEAAYNRLIARGRADVAVSGYGYRESKIISGNIKEIKDGQIILEVYPVNALTDPLLDQRIIKINESTKIYRMAEKTPEQLKQDSETFNKQMAEFNKKMKEQKIEEPSAPPMPPDPFGKQEIKLTDLKAGDQVIITAKDDIHAAKEFKAEEINIQPTATAPAVALPVK